MTASASGPGVAGHGLVALGDSITVGDGAPALGLPCRSWALWLAQALELPYTNLAVEAAMVADIRARQIPRLRGPYDLCCLYAGVNDARIADFDPAAFEVTLRDLASSAAQTAPRLLMVSIPLDLGRPRAGDSVGQANRAIRKVASELGATVVALDDLRGWRVTLPDAVHLTALGQVLVAERAARALAGVGIVPAAFPVDLAGAGASGSRRADLRYALTGYAPALLRDLGRRAREGTLLIR